MMNIQDITTFFGWCTVINFSLYTILALFIVLFKNVTTDLHSKLMGLDSCELPRLYFKFLSHYKVGIMLFSLTPYIALKLME